MSVLGQPQRGSRRSRRAAIGLAAGVAAVALPLVGATSAHAAEYSGAPVARTTHAVVAPAPAAFTTTPSATPTTTASSGDVAPLATALRITESYGVRGPWAAGHHTGVDLAAATGTGVQSVGEGTVVRSGWDGAYGIDVLVKLSDGHYALFGHLSQAMVFAGEHVAAGQEIGRSGATGHVTGPHLHFEVRTTPSYGSDVNPVAYLRAHGVTI